MEHYRLAEGEYRFASIVWENEPVPSGRLAELCLSRLGWKKSTTYTVLKKLTERGILRNENAVVTSLVPREQVQQAESQALIDHTFGGSLPSFLTAFMGGRTIPDQEAEELKALIDRFREGGGNHD